MLSNISASGQQFLNSLSNVQDRLNRAQLQISSGLKVATPSDAPDEVSQILQLHANLQVNQQTTNNLVTVQGEVTTADQSLSSAITILDQAQVLASQALAINQTAGTRASIATQVQDLLSQLVSISSKSFAGRYIFSGDSDQSPSYQYDPISQTATRLQVSPSTRQIADATGLTFPVGLSANDIFDVRDALDQPTTGNAFAALSAITSALLANDPVALQAQIGALEDASTHVIQQQTFYGSAENRISAALSQASDSTLTYQKDLSNRQDADPTVSIVELQQGTTNLQAAMAAYSKVPHTSLFSVLSNS